MLPNERRKKIVNLLINRKFLSVNQLAKTLYSSEATIRRDLNYLEKIGEIIRTNGGALLLENSRLEKPILLSSKDNLEQKNIISELAIQFVSDNSNIFLDSSSTCFTLTKKLQNFQKLTILTNGLLTAHILSEATDFKIYCTGGSVYSKRSSANGWHACRYIDEHFADIAFVSCKGIDDINGITDLTEEESVIKQYYQKNAKKTIALIDSSKFNKHYFCTALTFNQIDVIISDKPLPKNIQSTVERYSIQTIYPDD